MKVSEKQSIRRREIAETIRDILTEGGLEELTVDDICRANGISKVRNSFWTSFPATQLTIFLRVRQSTLCPALLS